MEMPKQITACPTRAGKGFKLVVNDTWFYTSIRELSKMLAGNATACRFRQIKGDNNGQ